MRSLARLIYFRILGWKLIGSLPDLDQYVLIIAPHTSNWDFVLGLLVRQLIGTRIHFVAKDSLFMPPFGWYFRWLGGSPIDRSRSRDTVRAVAKIFSERKTFRLALSPEGTRKKVATWKTGFYYIAIAAHVPIVMVAFDFGKKKVKISEPVSPSGDREADFKSYMDFYRGVLGKVPENGF